MASNSKLTREYILSELAKNFVNKSTLEDDEVTSSMFIEEMKSKGVVIRETTARTFLRRMTDDDIMSVRDAIHNGHLVKAYRYLKGKDDGNS